MNEEADPDLIDFDDDDIVSLDDSVAALESSLKIVARYKRGELGRDEAIRALVDDGHDGEDDAANFLMHAAHQKELDKLRTRKGIIID